MGVTERHLPSLRRNGSRRIAPRVSEGCQVIEGRGYLMPDNELVDCSAFAALGTRQLETDVSKTRGAYNVLRLLVVALGSDLESQTVKYMLLTESNSRSGQRWRRASPPRAKSDS